MTVLTLTPSEEARQQGRGRGREVRVGEEAGQTLRPSEGHRGAGPSQDCGDPGEIRSGGRWELKIIGILFRKYLTFQTRPPAVTCSWRATRRQHLNFTR